jgi:DNA end-binding protein Ku
MPFVPLGAGYPTSMVRSVWSGTLSFGLVAIPVRLIPATEPKDIRFHLVDAESGRRVRYRRVLEDEQVVTHPTTHPTAGDGPDEDEGTSAPPPRIGSGSRADPAEEDPAAEDDVPFDSLARGYEVEPGAMVTLTPEELRAARPAPSHTIEIEDFVELEQIDPVYFEKSYVVAPQAGGTAERPYALLLRALEEAGRVGIGRFVLRTRPHLVAVRPRAGALGLETLFFGDEVRAPSQIVSGVDTVEIGERELAMAQQLLGMLATEWDPARYTDTYREELRSLIARKTPTREDEPLPVASDGPSAAERLMDALRASVERAGRRPEDPGEDPDAVSTSSSR